MSSTPKTDIKNVVIARNAYDWQYGGAEQFAYNLASVMRDVGIEPIVVSRVPELLRHCAADHIKTVRNVWLKNRTRRRWMPVYYILFPLLVGQYVWIMLRSRADLLIVTSRDDQIFGTIAAKLTGTPVVWFDHADMKHIVAQPFWFLSQYYYWALESADAVIMTSRAEHEKISANLPSSKQRNFTTINNGAIKKAGKPLARPDGILIVAYAGRLDRDKGLFDLVEAAGVITSKFPRVQFWIAGKGPDEAQLISKVAKLKLTDHFKFLGHMNNVSDLLETSDIFVYPTHHDAAPLAPAEAVLAGVPVVASRVGGIPEMISEDAGILVPPHRPDLLADTVVSLLSDSKKLAKLRKGAQASGHALEFSTVLIEQYLPLFRRIIRRRYEDRN